MPETDQDIAYDARQGYAKLINESMLLVFDSRVRQEFYSWFKALEDLKTITLHNWKKKDENLNKYNEKVKKIKELSNKFSATWRGVNRNQNEVSEVEDILRDLEEFIYEKMKEGKIFGESQRIEGLA